MKKTNLLSDVRTNALNQVNLKKQATLYFNEVLRLWKTETDNSEINFYTEFGDCPTFVWDSWGGAGDISIEYIMRFELDMNGDLQKVVVRNMGYMSDEEEISASEFFANDRNDLNFYSQMILEFLKR